MLKHPQITLQRVQSFSTQRGLAGLIYTERAPVGLSVFAAPGRIPYHETLTGNYRPTQVGEKFGPFWSTHWFRVEIKFPRMGRARGSSYYGIPLRKQKCGRMGNPCRA